MKYQHIQRLLIDLQQELRQLDLWQQESPPVSALRSTQPFAVDTLDFHKWLQFIMIPRLQAIVVERGPLPSNMAVSPMAVQVYKGQLKTYRNLISCLRDIDTAVSGVDPMQAS